MDFLNSLEAVSEATDASFKLARLRSEALYEYYAAERRAGVDVLTAHERMVEFSKRLDARSPFEVEQEAVTQIMESA